MALAQDFEESLGGGGGEVLGEEYCTTTSPTPTTNTAVEHDQPLGHNPGACQEVLRPTMAGVAGVTPDGGASAGHADGAGGAGGAAGDSAGNKRAAPPTDSDDEDWNPASERAPRAATRQRTAAAAAVSTAIVFATAGVFQGLSDDQDGGSSDDEELQERLKTMKAMDEAIGRAMANAGSAAATLGAKMGVLGQQADNRQPPPSPPPLVIPPAQVAAGVMQAAALGGYTHVGIGGHPTAPSWQPLSVAPPPSPPPLVISPAQAAAGFMQAAALGGYTQVGIGGHPTAPSWQPPPVAKRQQYEDAAPIARAVQLLRAPGSGAATQSENDFWAGQPNYGLN